MKCLSNFCHFLEATLLVALLQPPPETYHLFDDVMLLSSGRLMYSGPRSEVCSQPERHILRFRVACHGTLLVLSPLCCSLVTSHAAETLAWTARCSSSMFLS